MKQLIKHIISYVLALCLFVSNISFIHAEEPQTFASYDLEKGGIQTFYVNDQEGYIGIVTIEKIESQTKIADNKYKITYDFPGMWKAGFYVIITSNQISSAYSPFHTALTGDIIRPTLIRNSSTMASYTFIHQAALLNHSTGVRATMSGSTLKVSKI